MVATVGVLLVGVRDATRLKVTCRATVRNKKVN